MATSSNALPSGWALASHLGLDGKVAREGNVRGETNPEALRVEGFDAVDRAEKIGDERWFRPVVQFGHEDLIDEFPRRRQGLTSAPEFVGHLGHRLKPPRVLVEGEAARGEIERHRLQAPFEHQRAGHAGIVLEVALEEPVVFVKVENRAQVAATPWPAGHVDGLDLINEQHVARGDPRGHGVGEGAQVGVAEGVPDPAFGERDHVLA